MTDVVFRRIHGRIVPIRRKGTDNRMANAALATNVVSGVVSALSLIGSKRRVFLGQTASFGLDLGSSSLNAAAHRGVRGRSNRLRATLKGEAINTAAGYAAFGITALAHKPTRQAVLSGASKVLSKIGAFARRAAL
jgi:hypothetical protein